MQPTPRYSIEKNVMTTLFEIPVTTADLKKLFTYLVEQLQTPLRIHSTHIENINPSGIKERFYDNINGEFNFPNLTFTVEAIHEETGRFGDRFGALEWRVKNPAPKDLPKTYETIHNHLLRYEPKRNP